MVSRVLSVMVYVKTVVNADSVESLAQVLKAPKAVNFHNKPTKKPSAGNRET
jgi:hypothetical protein